MAYQKPRIRHVAFEGRFIRRQLEADVRVGAASADINRPRVLQPVDGGLIVSVARVFGDRSQFEPLAVRGQIAEYLPPYSPRSVGAIAAEFLDIFVVEVKDEALFTVARTEAA